MTYLELEFRDSLFKTFTAINSADQKSMNHYHSKVCIGSKVFAFFTLQNNQLPYFYFAESEP